MSINKDMFDVIRIDHFTGFTKNYMVPKNSYDAVGGNVVVIENADNTGFITSIKPRRNYIIRRASNLSKESHILASNLDQAFLLVSFAPPVTATVFIDRFLATAEAYRVPVVIIINKVDVLDSEWLEYVEAFKYLYEGIGYKVCAISATTGEGVDALRRQLSGKVTLFSMVCPVSEADSLILFTVSAHNS